mmetsp:Transcript_18503/g.51445  ORF Transcript_18503/g.51445 Transcript_18503/m.51445 type:complete len:152 (-) Transcript_18503:1609-2064(-)
MSLRVQHRENQTLRLNRDSEHDSRHRQESKEEEHNTHDQLRYHISRCFQPSPQSEQRLLLLLLLMLLLFCVTLSFIHCSFPSLIRSIKRLCDSVWIAKYLYECVYCCDGSNQFQSTKGTTQERSFWNSREGRKRDEILLSNGMAVGAPMIT